MQNKRIHFKSLILISIVVFILAEQSQAQRWKMRRYEFGGGIGSSQVFGDIGGTASDQNWFGLRDLSIDETNIAGALHGAYKKTHRVSFQGNFNFGMAQGSDEGSKSDRGRSYSTTMFELSGQVKYFFVTEDKKYRSAALYSKRGMVNNYSTFAAYAFAGAGVNFALVSHGDAVVLPVDEYRSGLNIVPVIPFGVGVRYILDDRTYLEGEFGYRYAITDFIDGYNQTASSKYSDLYYFFIVSYNYRIKTTRRNLPSFLDRKARRRR